MISKRGLQFVLWYRLLSYKKLQYAQNCSARLIYNKRKYDHVTELLIDLYWLSIKYRILYQIYLLAYKCINLALFAPSEKLKSLVSTDSTKFTRFVCFEKDSFDCFEKDNLS